MLFYLKIAINSVRQHRVVVIHKHVNRQPTWKVPVLMTTYSEVGN